MLEASTNSLVLLHGASAAHSAHALERNPGVPFDAAWLDPLRVNQSAVERRTATLGTRRAVKKDAQAAWLLKAITCIDLTTLNGDDTEGRVRRLCAKARRPVRADLLEALGVEPGSITTGAVCVYHRFVAAAVDALAGSGIPVAAVSTGFPAGLLLLVEQEHFGHLWFTWLLMAIACGVCAYYAVGKGGYIALLSAITLVIVAGHGDNELVDGFWRAVNVLIGIVIALLFSFALPLYATWSWRYKLAGVLRECAAIYTRMLGGPAPVSGLSKAIAEQRAVLVQLRSLMPSVSAEVDLPVGQLDAMQRELQLCISTIELLPAMLPAPGVVRGPLDQALPPSETLYIREMLVGASRALKQGSLEYLHAPAPPALPGADAPPAPSVPPALQAYAMLTGQLYEHADKLRALLLATAGHWNI